MLSSWPPSQCSTRSFQTWGSHSSRPQRPWHSFPSHRRRYRPVGAIGKIIKKLRLSESQNQDMMPRQLYKNRCLSPGRRSPNASPNAKIYTRSSPRIECGVRLDGALRTLTFHVLIIGAPTGRQRRLATTRGVRASWSFGVGACTRSGARRRWSAGRPRHGQ